MPLSLPPSKKGACKPKPASELRQFIATQQSTWYPENSPFDVRDSSSFTPSQTLFPRMLALNLLIVQYTP